MVIKRRDLLRNPDPAPAQPEVQVKSDGSKGSQTAIGRPTFQKVIDFTPDSGQFHELARKFLEARRQAALERIYQDGRPWEMRMDSRR